MPEPNKRYSLKSYWDERFKEETNFEWLCSWDDIRMMVLPYLPASFSRCVILGNGSSQLPVSLSREFPQCKVVSTDYSEVAVRNSQEAPFSPSNLEYTVADMTDLRGALGGKEWFGSVDVVIDKGALDALVSANGDEWSPSPESLSTSFRLCQGVHASLREGGIFLQCSFSQPHFRAQHLLQCRTIPSDSALPSPHGGRGEADDSALEKGCTDDEEWERDLTPHPVTLCRPPVEGSFWTKFEVLNVDRNLGYFLYICTK